MLSLIIFFILSISLYYVTIFNKKRVIHQNETFVESTQNRNDVYQTKINNTEQELDQTQNPDELIYHHMKLWKLYYEGTPDKYDFEGNRIPGTSPDPELSLYHINEAIANGYNEGYIMLAKMYHFGFHNFEENKEEAKQIYMNIIDNGLPNREEALKNFQIIIEEERYSNMSNWLNIPSENIKTTMKGGNQFAIVDRDDHMRNVKRVKDEQRNHREFNQPIHIITQPRYNNPKLINVQLQNRKKKQPIRNDIRNDTQNVHDSALIRTVKQSIENLKKSTNLSINHSDSLRNMRNYIRSKPDCDKKNDALRTLDAMERTSKPLVAFKMKETDLLNLVWNRINNNHFENKENLQDNLYDQLANSVEHDKVVCTTGRFTRVLDSLNVVDDQVAIKPRSLINRELMDKSAMIRKELYDTESEGNRKMIDSIQDNDVQKRFTEKLKHNIRTQFKDDYVSSKVLSQTELDEEVNKWIDYI